MSPWTQPRAYIIRMNARDLRSYHQIEQARAEAAYANYVAELARKREQE